MRTKILTLGLISLLMLSCVLSAKDKKQAKSWLDYFPDLVERIYIIMKDGMAFKHTNYEERLIRIGAGWLEETLKKKGYRIKDISIIIHNHRIERKFSDADWRFYRDLKKREFNGRFLIYCHLTKAVYSISLLKQSD